MITKNKTKDLVKAYTYLLIFEIDEKIQYYYGMRGHNVKLDLSPSKDLWIKYFTSSRSVLEFRKLGIFPKSIIIHKQFESIKDAGDFEVAFLTRIKAASRRDFLNKVDHFNNGFAYSNKNRKMSEETKKAIGISSSKWQSEPDKIEYRRKLMKEKWNDPEFRARMKAKNDAFWTGEKGKEHIKTRTPAMLGKRHSSKAKKKMSESTKIERTKLSMVELVKRRKRYSCVYCNMKNLDGRNFNNHMIAKHSWSKEECTLFKKSSTPQ